MIKRFLIVFLLSTTLSANPPTWIDYAKEKITTIDGKQIAKDALETFVKCWVAAITHESGHAIAGKMLTEAQPIIHLGSHSSDTLFIKPFGPFCLQGFQPTGYVSYYGNSENIKKIKEDIKKNLPIIAAAGPIVEALTFYLCTVCTNSFRHPEWSWKEKLLYSLLEIEQYACLIMSLIPSGTNDGTLIFPQIKIDPRGAFLIQITLMATLAIIIGKLREKYTKDAPRFWAKLITTIVTRYGLVPATHSMLKKIL